MRLEVAAIGRLKAGPERALCDDYRARAVASGRSLGISDVTEREVDTKARTAALEADALVAAAGLSDAGGSLCVTLLDEHGAGWTSQNLADHIASWRDSGVRRAVFLIGGADGHGPAARAAAGHVWALGPQTWPHKLVRVMVFEQLYRAVSILAGSPYHRA